MKAVDLTKMSTEKLKEMRGQIDKKIEKKIVKAEEIREKKKKEWRNKVPPNYDGDCPRKSFDPAHPEEGGWEDVEEIAKLPYHNLKKAAVITLRIVRKHFKDGATSVDIYTIGGMYRGNDGHLHLCGQGRWGNTLAQAQFTKEEFAKIIKAGAMRLDDGYTLIPTRDIRVIEKTAFGKKTAEMKIMG